MESTVIHKPTVADAMQPYNAVSPETPLTEAAALMRSRSGIALIVETDDGSPAIFTEFDVLKVVGAGESLDGKLVADHHTRVVIAATPDWPLSQAIDTMMRGRFRHLVVADGGQVVGLLAMRDILRVLQRPIDHSDAAQETGEFAAQIHNDANVLLQSLRRGAKQHLAATKCYCELDWIDVLVGQVEERPDLTRGEIELLWEQRQLCPVLHAMGGGGD